MNTQYVLLGSVSIIVGLCILLVRARRQSMQLRERLVLSMHENDKLQTSFAQFQARYVEHTNICEACVQPGVATNYQLADTGRCSVCGEIGECWDFELLKLYQSLSISDELIRKELPRLLNRHLDRSQRHSLVDIKNRILAVTSRRSA